MSPFPVNLRVRCGMCDEESVVLHFSRTSQMEPSGMKLRSLEIGESASLMSNQKISPFAYRSASMRLMQKIMTGAQASAISPGPRLLMVCTKTRRCHFPHSTIRRSMKLSLISLKNRSTGSATFGAGTPREIPNEYACLLSYDQWD